MIVLLFLCIKLSILHLCVVDGFNCGLENSKVGPEIFLINSEEPPKTVYDKFRKQLNLEFKEFCRDYYNIKNGSLKDAEMYGQYNIIQFAVHGNYDFEKFEYAGNVSKIDDAVCTKNITLLLAQSGEKAGKDEFDCEVANLVSPSIKHINNGHVYDIVQEMQLISNNNYLIVQHRESCEPHFQKISDISTVLLCSRSNRLPDDYIEKQVILNAKPLTLIQIPADNCRDYFNEMSYLPSHLNRLLAVLAPNPFELSSEYSVPTIFYEIPYLSSEDKTYFPNSMSLIPWRLLKFGFLKFIQKLGWQRVAIVTDDSEYSLEFEDELTALFAKERLIYTVIRCEDAECDMNKIKEKLRKVPARIVIANVDERHAKDLLQGPDKITWLLRDLAERVNPQRKAFSFSLHSTNDTGCTDMEDNIMTGLQSIAQAYKSLRKDVKKREFYSLFAETLKQMTPKVTKAIIEVKNLKERPTLVASMYVNRNGAKINYYVDPYENDKTAKPSDGTAHCLMSSYNYFEPCEDPLVMLFMFILMMFVLTILLIMCFFDKTSPFNDIRYQNF